jgi:16S rRNA (guanine966-N2)-methyltransferase
MKSRKIRIIGGDWRGRKLSVIDANGLRPTPDRIRETLFNWLAADCRAARVLDCFAGSGVLGFEALSRGASSLVVFEQNPQAVDNLRQQAQCLGNEAVEIVAGDALQLIASLKQQFDIIFIDPPYGNAGLRTRAMLQLEAGQCLREGCKIYFEWPRSEAFELPSENLQWWKQKSAGQVNYAIAEWRLSS